ncbi:MAG: transferrin-binding protein-like solute binding protein [Proteobacteria bacterium]|nr:transferrin-binding protein-like solute binding protein [Pseudomonadota bacterium]
MRKKFWRYAIVLITLCLPVGALAQEMFIKASNEKYYRITLPESNNVKTIPSQNFSTLKIEEKGGTGTNPPPADIVAELISTADKLQQIIAFDTNAHADKLSEIRYEATEKLGYDPKDLKNADASTKWAKTISRYVKSKTDKMYAAQAATDIYNQGKKILGATVTTSAAVWKFADTVASELLDLTSAAVEIDKEYILSQVATNTRDESYNNLEQVNIFKRNLEKTTENAINYEAVNTAFASYKKTINLKNTATELYNIATEKKEITLDNRTTEAIREIVLDTPGAIYNLLYTSKDNLKAKNDAFLLLEKSTERETEHINYIAIASEWVDRQPQHTTEQTENRNKDKNINVAELAEAQRQADEAAQKKAEADDLAAALQKDLDVMGAEMSSLASKLAKAGDKERLEAALEKSKKEYDDSRSRQRMLSRQVNTYKEALKQLTGAIKTYEVTINGQVFRPEDVPSLQQRVAEQSAILTQLEKTFSNPGGLKNQYEAARERLDAFKQIEKQQADAQAKLAAAKEALKKVQADAQAADEALKNNQALVAEREAAINATPQDALSIEQPAAWQPPVTLENQYDPAPFTTLSSTQHNTTHPEELREDTFTTLTTSASSSSGSSSSSNILNITFLAGKFRETPLKVNSEYYDIDELVTAIFGGYYRVADWTDLQTAYANDPQGFVSNWSDGSGSLETIDPPLGPFVEGQSYPNGRNPMVKRNGSRSAGRITYGGETFNRQYGVDYLGGTVPSYYLEHDHIDNHTYSLGSWNMTTSILALKTNSDPEPTIDTAAGPNTYEEWIGFCSWLKASPLTNGTAIIELMLGLNPETSTISHTFAGTASTVNDSFYSGKELLGVAYTSAGTGQAGWLANGADAVATGTFNYLTWGEWNENTSYDVATGAIVKVNNISMPWIAGQLTPGNEVPTTGSATYNGSVIGAVGQTGDASSVQRVAGNLALQADFASRALTGQFNTMHLQNGGPWKDFNVTASWAGGTNSISGTIASTDSSTNGTMEGKFYGPNAAELGGAWHSFNGTGEFATGIFVGKKQ